MGWVGLFAAAARTLTLLYSRGHITIGRRGGGRSGGGGAVRCAGQLVCLQSAVVVES